MITIYRIVLYHRNQFIAQDNLSSSQQTNFNKNQFLCKNKLSMNKNGAIHKPSNSNIEPFISHEVLSC